MSTGLKLPTHTSHTCTLASYLENSSVLCLNWTIFSKHARSEGIRTARIPHTRTFVLDIQNQDQSIGTGEKLWRIVSFKLKETQIDCQIEFL